MKWDERGLAAAIVQDARSGAVLMLGWMNAEALERTLASGNVWFWSRSRSALWMKGETSGNTLEVREVRTDCDEDAILVRAIAAGPTCHQGQTSCFSRPNQGPRDDGPGPTHVLDRLAGVLASRRGADPASSYTAALLAGGSKAIATKIREEGGELASAIEGESGERIAAEAADVLYHLLVGLLGRGVSLESVWVELDRRAGRSGVEEKASRG